MPMPWTKVIGHDRIKKILQRSLAEKRVPHAWCFTGKEGVGKEAMAIYLARALNCQNPSVAGENYDSCGQCRSCKSFDNLSHPNFDLVFALPPGKGPQKADESPIENLAQEQVDLITEEISRKAADNYHKISIPNATQIKVGQIRELKRKIALTSDIPGQKCILISDAEKLTNESANAFLKTLEEPTEGVSIILCTSRPELLLQTIMSRCQVIRFGPLDSGEIAAELERKGIPHEQAVLAASLGEGSIKKAFEALEHDFIEMRDLVIEALRAALKKNNYRLELSDIADKILALGDKSKIVTFLNLTALWLRDVKISATGADIGRIVNKSQIDTINKFAKNFANRDLITAVNKIEESSMMIYRNVAPQMLIISLFLELRQLFLGLKH
jgi:DNA polymerase-3 subunit delta'